jgi:FkbM family methyltransferase
MNIVQKSRRHLVGIFRASPALYDLFRQARLRLMGPTTQIGGYLDCFFKNYSEYPSFLQKGASDGLRNDPVRDFIVRDGWSGVFVEPLPDVFPLLQRNYERYATRQGLQFVNAAIASHSKSLPFYTFSDSFLATKPLEERLHFLRKASFSREQVKSFANSDEDIAIIHVPCLGIGELLATYFPEGNLGLLALDVEGHECEILTEIDFAQTKISAVLFETWNLQSNREKVFEILRTAGYLIHEAEGDALAVKKAL